MAGIADLAYMITLDHVPEQPLKLLVLQITGKNRAGLNPSSHRECYSFHLFHQNSKLRWIQGLRAIAKGFFRIGMHLDDKPVSPDRNSRFGQGRNVAGLPGRMAGIDNYRQVRFGLDYRHAAYIKSISCRGLESPDPPFTEHKVAVVFGEDVLSGHEKFIDSGRGSSLKQNRLPCLPQQGQQGEVLDIAGAHLEHIGILIDYFDVFGINNLGNDRQAGSLAGFGKESQPVLSKTLK